RNCGSDNIRIYSAGSSEALNILVVAMKHFPSLVSSFLNCLFLELLILSCIIWLFPGQRNILLEMDNRGNWGNFSDPPPQDKELSWNSLTRYRCCCVFSFLYLERSRYALMAKSFLTISSQSEK